MHAYVHVHVHRANYNSLMSDICQVNIAEMSGQVLLMPDQAMQISNFVSTHLLRKSCYTQLNFEL